MRPALIVTDKEVVENGLHLVDRLEPSAPTFDAEVLVEPGAMEALHDAVRLRALDAGGTMLDVLELQKQLVGMLVGPPAELTAVVGEHGVDFRGMRLEGRDDIAAR